MRRGLSTDVWTALFVWGGGLLGPVVGCGGGVDVAGRRNVRSCIMVGRCRFRRRMGSSLRRVRLFMVTVVGRVMSLSLCGAASGSCCGGDRRRLAYGRLRRDGPAGVPPLTGRDRICLRRSCGVPGVGCPLPRKSERPGQIVLSGASHACHRGRYAIRTGPT